MSQEYFSISERKYKRFNERNRIEIQCWLKDGVSFAEIARRTGFHRSSISREIERGSVMQQREVKVKPCFENYYTRGIRNESYKEYFADTGQQCARENKERKKKRFKLFEEEGYAEFIEEQILRGKKKVSVYTANILARKADCDGVTKFRGVCDRTLYNYIHLGLLKVTKSDLLLTVQRKPNVKRKVQTRFFGDIIDLRPKEANERKEFGHFEGDSIIGAGQKGQIITLVERVTRIGFLYKFDKKSARNILYVKKALQKRYGKDFSKIFRSITFDNGSEFAYNDSLRGTDKFHLNKKQDIQIYYAHAYSSWERGSNENFNGIVRRFIPKKRSFEELRQEDILRIGEAINEMPRKIFGGKNAKEMFAEEIAIVTKRK